MWGTVFRDVLLLAALTLAVVTGILVIYINDPADEITQPPAGNVAVAITWPEGDIDVDLWVFGPGEKVAVGYSNLGGALWNLLRDDTGGNDVVDVNYENAYTRGLVPGRYWINLHCFSCYGDARLPVPVKVEVVIRKGNSFTGRLDTVARLSHHGQEITAFSFMLDEDGDIVSNSVNNEYRSLRANESPHY